MDGRSLRRKSPEVRLWSRVEKLPGDGCWLWRGGINTAGYGFLTLRDYQGGSRGFRAHRLAYTLTTGEPIPEGLYLCHKCDNRRCVRPDHMFLGTARDNTWDAIAKGRLYRDAPHDTCQRGHPMSGRNLLTSRRPDGSPIRNCRACGRLSENARRRRRTQEAKQQKTTYGDAAVGVLPSLSTEKDVAA